MIILNILKNNYFNSFSKNLHLSFRRKIDEAKYKRINSMGHKGFFGDSGYKTFGSCFYHLSPKHKKDIELYPKKMLSFFEKSTKGSFILGFEQKTRKQEPYNFFLYKAKNSSICFHEIIIADTLSRKQRDTAMQIPALEKITCSYTGKELVSSPTELSIPMCALTFLSGQNCTIVWAGKSVSSWKLRKNGVIGCKVTLRRKSAIVFLEKFYVYGREGLIEKKNNFLNNLPFYFGVGKNKIFIELQKSDRLSSNFSGFSISIN